MKKCISLILTVILALSLCAVSLADDPNEIPGTTEMPTAGLRFTPPEVFRETKGVFVTDGAMLLAEYVNYAYWYYGAMTTEEYNAAITDVDALNSAPIAYLFHVFSIGNGMGLQALADLGINLGPEDVREIGDTTFYLYLVGPDQEFADSIRPEYREEYLTLAGAGDDVSAAFTFYEPAEPYADMIGRKFEFTTTDLDGNTVSSEELFAQHEVTMVNLWATWCSPCVGELAELQQIHLRLQGKDCAVVGILVDNDVNSARQLLSENGVTYTVLLQPDNLNEFFAAEYIPSTLFIGRDGTVVATPVIGANVEAYEPKIDSVLQK